MTLAEAEEVFGYWEQQPPTCHLVSIIAQMLGWVPERRPAGDKKETMSAGEIAAEAAKFGMPVVSGGLGMPAPVLDIDAFREKIRPRLVEIARRNVEAAG